MLTANRIHQFLNSAREWDQLMRRQSQMEAAHQPRVAVKDHSIYFELDLPGWTKDNISVEVDRDSLQVITTKPAESEESGVNWVTRERTWRSEDFRFQFPFSIDAERAEVTFEAGVLAVTVHQPAEEVPRKLTVK